MLRVPGNRLYFCARIDENLLSESLLMYQLHYKAIV
jgi:hypothetical protein